MSSDKKEDTCFPFNSGEDITPIIDMELNEEEGDQTNNELNEIVNIKFITKKYYLNEKGKKRREKKGRKYKPDDVRKKIKVKIHKTLKIIMNNNLKKAGSQKYFKYLPQYFIGNISQKFNFKFLDFTYKDLLLTDFTTCEKDYKYKNSDYNNYLSNKDTVEYLEKNNEVSINSGFELIKNMKYKDILKAYFSSKQYENSLIELKNKKEDYNYIQAYIKLSKNYLEYFSSNDKTKDKDELSEDIKKYLLSEEFEKLRKNLGI